MLKRGGESKKIVRAESFYVNFDQIGKYYIFAIENQWKIIYVKRRKRILLGRNT